MSTKRKTMILTAAAALVAGLTFPAAGTADAAASFVKIRYDSRNGMELQFNNVGTGQQGQSCDAELWKGDRVDEIKRNMSFPTALFNQSGKVVDAPVIGRPLPGAGPEANAVSTAYFYETDAAGMWLGNVYDLVNNDDRNYRAKIVRPATALVGCGTLGGAVVLLPADARDKVWYSGENVAPAGSLQGLFG